MIRVFIVASSSLNLSGLEGLLRGDARFEIVGSGSRLRSAGLSSLDRRPDAVLMDASAINGVLSALRFTESLPIVLMSDDSSRSGIRNALRSGVRAIVGRHASPREIAAALEAVAAGLTILGTEQMDALLPTSFDHFETVHVAAELLTGRETEVLGMLAEGAGNKEIAQRLKLSEHTVKFHVSSILGKLGAVTRTEAVARGIQQGLVLI
jgi:two-component system, NarL family, response regulator YdfI